MRKRFLQQVAIGVVALILWSGCSPSLSPLYRDYQASEQYTGEEEILSRIQAALTEAGWTVTDSPASNVVATERRTLGDWGLYRVEVYLEAAPLAGDYVRLFVHPHRRFFTGGQSKIPFLKGSLRRNILPALNSAFARHGLELADSPRERGVVDSG